YFIVRYIYIITKEYIKSLKNDTKIKQLLKFKNYTFVTKLSYLISELDLKFRIKNINFLTPIFIIIISIAIFFISFILLYSYLKIFLTCIILSIFISTIPYLILKFMIYSKKKLLLKIFPNYVISLKNYTETTNNILIAFKNARCEYPLDIYINKFNVSVDKGINIYDSFEELKNNINIKEISEFLTSIQFCYINGGNFTELLDEFSNIQMKVNLQKEKESENIFSSKVVLILLIVINVYILFGFIMSTEEYYSILTKTFIGEMILNVNVLSYIIIFYFYLKLNKLEG
ncbi:MAG: hypothetical protein RSF67_07550, partial [Clostridia bacterium]